MSYKSRNCFAAIVLAALFTNPVGVTAQTARFRVSTLKTLGGSQTTAYGINNLGWVTGGGSFPGDKSEHALLWQGGA